LLEKMETAYGGRFKLVKIDSDQEQQLAAAFGIRSIPTCILLKNGQPVDGFMGAVPEGKLREFLDKHIPSEVALLAESETQAAEELMASGDLQTAQAKLEDALAANPGNDDARFDLIKILISTGQFEQADALLAPMLKQIPLQLRFDALNQWLQTLIFVTTDPRGQWEIGQFDALIAENKRDFDARFAKSRVLIALDDWTGAMDELLEIIMRDKKWGDDAPRKTFVALLELLTPPKPKVTQDANGKSAGGIELMGKTAVEEDPQAQLVSSYRRKLSMMLN
jgi:putative thioredoxin